MAFTEKCLKWGQCDSQKTFENPTQQAFAQSVRAGGDDGFKKRKKRYPVAFKKAISARPRLNHTLHGRKITPVATQTVFKLRQPSRLNGPNR
jgi:hypothetical protein